MTRKKYKLNGHINMIDITSILKLNNRTKINTTIKIIPSTQKAGRDTFVTKIKKDLLDLNSDEINQKIHKAVKRENYLGGGTEGDVYRIPNTGYCVKILYKGDITKQDKWTRKINTHDKVNHIVAKSNNNALLMKYIKGKQLPYMTEDKPAEIFNLPDKSYKDMIKQVQQAKKLGLNFDWTPANVIFNKDTLKLTAIDFYKPVLETEDNQSYNSIAKIFNALHEIGNSPATKKKNLKLGTKFISIVLDELKNPKSTILVEKNDISELINKINISQGIESKNKTEKLKNAFYNIINLRNNNPLDLQTKKQIRENEIAINKLIEELYY